MAAVTQDADRPSMEGPLERAMSMLVEALEILDAQEVPPELGARLQGVIEDLNDYASS